MNRNFWERIQRNYPTALHHCINHFKGRFPGWRKEMKDTDQLLLFFLKQEVEITVRKFNSKYGFELRTSFMTIRVKRKWDHRDNALWWGIDYGFKSLEERCIGMIYRPVFVRRPTMKELREEQDTRDQELLDKGKE